jgi:hypothetical protein
MYPLLCTAVFPSFCVFVDALCFSITPCDNLLLTSIVPLCVGHCIASSFCVFLGVVFLCCWGFWFVGPLVPCSHVATPPQPLDRGLSDWVLKRGPRQGVRGSAPPIPRDPPCPRAAVPSHPHCTYRISSDQGTEAGPQRVVRESHGPVKGQLQTDRSRREAWDCACHTGHNVCVLMRTSAGTAH